jgi:hypothetical protein
MSLLVKIYLFIFILAALLTINMIVSCIYMYLTGDRLDEPPHARPSIHRLKGDFR